MRRTEFSASNAARRVGCIGSANMERGLVVRDPESTREGTEIHYLAANPSEPRDHLGRYSLQCLLDYEERASETIAEFAAVHGQFARQNEPELIIKTPSGSIAMVNHADTACRAPKAVLVIDLKTGTVPADPVEDNWQIGTYLSSDEFLDCSDFYGQIIQPRLNTDQPVVHYTRAQIGQVRAKLLEAYEAGKDPAARRTPAAPICRYCSGFKLGLCKEALDATLFPVAETKLDRENIATTHEKLASLTMEERIRLLEAAQLADYQARIIKEGFRDLLRKDPAFVAGFYLGRPINFREITDPRSVIGRLRMNGISQEKIEDKISINLSTVEALLKEIHPNAKNKEISEMTDRLVEGCTDRVPQAERILKGKPPAPKKKGGRPRKVKESTP